MSVILPTAVTEIEEAQELPSLTYKLDLDKGRIIGKVDGIEAVKQAIRKALVTPRFRCLIYDNQYGSGIKKAIMADDATSEYIQSEIPRLVEDALSPDTRILDIYDYDFSFNKENAYISFKVSTIFGETTVQEVI